ncbi:alanine racemase [Bradyrhizobium sp. sBnM-33]|uniref:alanine racemase n=1 Tax=Bradyrhizobium sp. sBnM-33 TaxID=2831780 RepID=UPI001BCDE2FC|nr:alanine racemase [Bradyrhizobium sp. sBnM-33]WOH52589.1 alanine racemase [Bradyrhizobium sp. sBnM-33]
MLKISTPSRIESAENIAARSFGSVALTRANWIEIDLAALEHNVAVVRSMLEPGVRIHACVKSSAYGCGVVEVSQRFAAAGVDALCCGTFDEAVHIRAALPKMDLIMFGATLPDGIPAYLEHGLIPSVHNIELARAVSRFATSPTRVHIKVDGGWGRLGIPLPHAKDAILGIARLANIEIEAVYTHLPFTDLPGRDWAQQQTTAFCKLIDDLRASGLKVPITQARASNGVVFGITDECNAVSLGSILYGKSSAPRDLADFSNLRPACRSIRTKLIHVHPAFPGKTVGRTTGLHGRPTSPFVGITGVIPFGRRDGYAGARSGETAYVLIHGVRAPILAVNSELSVVDLSGVPDAGLGDDVIILGKDRDEEITLEDLSHWQGAGQTDVLVRMSGRLTRVFHQ